MSELAGVAQQIEQALFELGAVGMECAARRRANDLEAIRIGCRQPESDRREQTIA